MIKTYILKKLVETALDRFIDNTPTHMQKNEVPVARDAVVRDIEREVEAIIVNQTNNEPWYRSRVLIGSFFTLVAALSSLGVMFFDDVPNSFDDYYFQLSVVAGTAFAIYGRLATSKPIGN